MLDAIVSDKILTSPACETLVGALSSKLVTLAEEKKSLTIELQARLAPAAPVAPAPPAAPAAPQASKASKAPAAPVAPAGLAAISVIAVPAAAAAQEEPEEKEEPYTPATDLKSNVADWYKKSVHTRARAHFLARTQPHTRTNTGAERSQTDRTAATARP